MQLLPHSALRATLDTQGLNRPSPTLGVDLHSAEALGRRAFLATVGTGLALFGATAGAQALDFSPNDVDPEVDTEAELGAPPPTSAPSYALSSRKDPGFKSVAPPKLGAIPEDFWLRPRSLWLKRQGTRDEVRVVYWEDGKLLSEGYWQACAMLRDVRANLMTTIDPTILDVLRGISGYYDAWNYRQPLVLTSGFRTKKTNNALSAEGAAHNSMHLYGKAVDLYIPGIPSRDVGALGLHLQRGGVGVYPRRGFTHLDTGRLRSWVG